MEPRWISGKKLLTQLSNKEIFDAIEKDILIPYDKETRKEIVNSDKLLIVTNTGKGMTTYRQPTEKEIIAKLQLMKKPEDALLLHIAPEDVTDFYYSIEQVTALNKEHIVISMTTLSLGKFYKKQNPDMTVKQAAQAISKGFKESNMKPLSERQIRRIINKLGFKKGKPGRPSKKK